MRCFDDDGSDDKAFLYDFEKVLNEYDAVGGETSALYTDSLDDAYGDLISQYRDAASSYYAFDGLGSTDALLNDAEAETDTWQYKAFGEINDHTGTTPNNFSFVGKYGYYENLEIGLYFLDDRYYAPEEARFTSKDSLGLGPDDNPYRYVGNNPVNQVDPSGHELYAQNRYAAEYTQKFLRNELRVHSTISRTTLDVKYNDRSQPAYLIQLTKRPPEAFGSSFLNCIARIPHHTVNDPHSYLKAILADLDPIEHAFWYNLIRALTTDPGQLMRRLDAIYPNQQDPDEYDQWFGIKETYHTLVIHPLVKECSDKDKDEVTVYYGIRLESPEFDPAKARPSELSILLDIIAEAGHSPAVVSEIGEIILELFAGRFQDAFLRACRLLESATGPLYENLISLVSRILKCWIQHSSLPQETKELLIILTDAVADSLLAGSLAPLGDGLEKILDRLLEKAGIQDERIRKALTALVRAFVFRDITGLKKLAAETIIEFIDSLDISDTWKILLKGVIQTLADEDLGPLKNVALYFIDRMVMDAISDSSLDDKWKDAFTAAWKAVLAGARGGKDDVIRELSKVLNVEGLPERVDALINAVQAEDYHGIFRESLELGSFVLRNIAEKQLSPDDPDRDRLLKIAKGLDELKEYVDEFAKIANRDFSTPDEVRQALNDALKLGDRLEADLRKVKQDEIDKVADGLNFILGHGRQLKNDPLFWWAVPIFIAALLNAPKNNPCNPPGGWKEYGPSFSVKYTDIRGKTHTGWFGQWAKAYLTPRNVPQRPHERSEFSERNWFTALRGIVGNHNKIEMGHIIGSQLGGDGRDKWENLTPLFEKANKPAMSTCEGFIWRLVHECKFCVRIDVNLLFFGQNPLAPGEGKRAFAEIVQIIWWADTAKGRKQDTIRITNHPNEPTPDNCRVATLPCPKKNE